MLRRFFVIASLALLGGGCSLLEKDNLEPPAPLVSFTPSLTPQRAWTADTGAGIGRDYLRLTPALGGGRLITASPRGEVRAFDPSNGSLLWEQDSKLALTSAPGLGDDLLLVGSRQGEVLALSPADGSERWRSRVSSEVLAPPQAGAGLVVARSVDGKLTGLDGGSGARLWVYERSVPVLSLRGTSAPLILDDVVLAGFDNGKLVAVEARTGKFLWEIPVAQPKGRTELERMVDIDADIAVYRDGLYVTTYQGRTAAFDLQRGAPLWNRDTSAYSGMAVDNKAVYLSGADGYVWAFDRYTGTTLWKQENLKARGLTAPVLSGEHVIVGDVEGYVHWLRKADGEFAARAVTEEGAPILATPVVADALVVVLNSNGTLYAFSEAPASPDAAP